MFDIPEIDKTQIPSFQFITALVKDVFGTYFVEQDIWKADDDYNPIKRTYFSDRKKQKCAVNDKTEECIQFLYAAVMAERTTHDPEMVAQRFAQSVKRNFKINVDFLLFFQDDTPELRKAKIHMIYHLVRLLLEIIKNKESVESWQLDTWRDNGPMNKMFAYITSLAYETYTEHVIRNIHLTDKYL